MGLRLSRRGRRRKESNSARAPASLSSPFISIPHPFLPVYPCDWLCARSLSSTADRHSPFLQNLLLFFKYMNQKCVNYNNNKQMWPTCSSSSSFSKPVFIHYLLSPILPFDFIIQVERATPALPCSPCWICNSWGWKWHPPTPLSLTWSHFGKPFPHLLCFPCLTLISAKAFLVRAAGGGDASESHPDTRKPTRTLAENWCNDRHSISAVTPGQD